MHDQNIKRQVLIVLLLLFAILEKSSSRIIDIGSSKIECTDTTAEFDFHKWNCEPACGYASSYNDLPLPPMATNTSGNYSLSGTNFWYFVGNESNQAIYRNLDAEDNPTAILIKYCGIMEAQNPRPRMYIMPVANSFFGYMQPSDNIEWRYSFFDLVPADMTDFPLEFGTYETNRNEIFIVSQMIVTYGNSVTPEDMMYYCQMPTTTTTTTQSTTETPLTNSTGSDLPITLVPTTTTESTNTNITQLPNTTITTTTTESTTQMPFVNSTGSDLPTTLAPTTTTESMNSTTQSTTTTEYCNTVVTPITNGTTTPQPPDFSGVTCLNNVNHLEKRCTASPGWSSGNEMSSCSHIDTKKPWGIIGNARTSYIHCPYLNLQNIIKGNQLRVILHYYLWGHGIYTSITPCKINCCGEQSRQFLSPSLSGQWTIEDKSLDVDSVRDLGIEVVSNVLYPGDCWQWHSMILVSGKSIDLSQDDIVYHCSNSG